MPDLTEESARHYLADLRDARAAALADAEGFDKLFFSIERLGAFLLGRTGDLGKYREPLRRLAARSALAWDDGPVSPGTLRFERLFDLVKEARNDALHQGAAARHITRHCLDLTLILEDAIVSNTKQVSDFMAAPVVEAKLFEPIGSIRRTILMNAFSYLPVRTSEGWKLVADVAVAKFLRQAESTSARRSRLGMSLEIACSENGLQLTHGLRFCAPSDDVALLIAELDERPVLVLRNGSSEGELVAILFR